MQKLWGYVGVFFIIYLVPWLRGLAHKLVIVFLCARTGLGAFLRAGLRKLSTFFLSLTITTKIHIYKIIYLINSNKGLWKTKN